MNAFDAIDALQTVLGFATIAGIGGLWFKLGQAIESNNHTHTKLNSLSDRVRVLEQRAWKFDT
tara:strand:+ start:431 stop:619 length:189 start_codon:yes stop_codon:yes gene_type:complete